MSEWSCLFPIVVFVIFILIYSWFFGRIFITSIRCSSSNLRYIGAIFSSLSRASVSVYLIVLRISLMALLSVSPRTVICLSECIDCPHIIVTARSGCMSGKWVNWLYACLLFLVMFFAWRVKLPHLWWFSALASKRLF